MNRTRQSQLNILDAHVHIYDCFNIPTLLTSAYENFRPEALQYKRAEEFTGVLLLTETSKHDWFSRLSWYADTNKTIADGRSGAWRFSHTSEACSLLARSSEGRKLILIAGRQIVTKENLEVLALATRNTFRDGTPIQSLIMAINESDGIPVLSWGVGKWIGKRGKIVQSLVTGNDRLTFFLGDNSGRPAFWPRPALFHMAELRGTKILPGTDPLPLPSEASRCGSFGFALRGLVSDEQPATDIKRLIRNGTVEIRPYGKLEKPLRFIRNQLQIRLRHDH